MEKYGFVYIWHNTKKNKWYIGCHWGTEDDGYLCSSERMRIAYKRNPEHFRRRVIERIYTSRVDLLEAEHRWLQLIPNDELGKRYYNMSKRRFGHWSATPDARSIAQKSGDARRGKSLPAEEGRGAKISAAKKGKPFSEEHKAALRAARVGMKLSPEHRANISKSLKASARYSK
jgi:hypothetical protein